MEYLRDPRLVSGGGILIDDLLTIWRKGEVAFGWECQGKVRINPKRGQREGVLIRTQAFQVRPFEGIATIGGGIDRVGRWWCH